MMAAAMPKRITAITRGCADRSPIFVAVEADAHKIAKDTPVNAQVYLLVLIIVKLNATFLYQGTNVG